MAKGRGNAGREKPGPTPQQTEQVIAALRRGAFMDTAARFAGIAPRTFHSWLSKGREQTSGPYFAFVDAIEEAMAAAELRDLIAIDTEAQNGDWKAAAWKLERRHPERWNRQKVEASGTVSVVHRIGAIEGDPKSADLVKQLLNLVEEPTGTEG